MLSYLLDAAKLRIILENPSFLSDYFRSYYLFVSLHRVYMIGDDRAELC